MNDLKNVSKIKKKIKPIFWLKSERDVEKMFTEGWCFDFAYHYNKYINSDTNIKLLFQLFNDEGEFYFDLIHAFIELKNWKYIDVEGILNKDKLNSKYIKIKGIWDSTEDTPYDIFIINLNNIYKIDNQEYFINLDFILNLEPYCKNYINILGIESEKYENIWENML